MGVTVPKTPVILLVDDNINDLVFLKRTLARVGVTNPIREVMSGAEAIKYFKGAEKYANREDFPKPSVLLLDLKMPGVDGFEVLRWIRNNRPVDDLLVIVLSRLDEIKNVNQAYQLGAKSFWPSLVIQKIFNN